MGSVKRFFKGHLLFIYEEESAASWSGSFNKYSRRSRRRPLPTVTRRFQRRRSCRCWPWWARSPSWRQPAACTSPSSRSSPWKPDVQTPGWWRASGPRLWPRRWLSHPCWWTWWMPFCPWSCTSWGLGPGRFEALRPPRLPPRWSAPRRLPCASSVRCTCGKLTNYLGLPTQIQILGLLNLIRALWTFRAFWAFRVSDN